MKSEPFPSCPGVPDDSPRCRNQERPSMTTSNPSPRSGRSLRWKVGAAVPLVLLAGGAVYLTLARTEAPPGPGAVTPPAQDQAAPARPLPPPADNAANPA